MVHRQGHQVTVLLQPQQPDPEIWPLREIEGMLSILACDASGLFLTMFSLQALQIHYRSEKGSCFRNNLDRLLDDDPEGGT